MRFFKICGLVQSRPRLKKTPVSFSSPAPPHFAPDFSIHSIFNVLLFPLSSRINNISTYFILQSSLIFRIIMRNQIHKMAFRVIGRPETLFITINFPRPYCRGPSLFHTSFALYLIDPVVRYTPSSSIPTVVTKYPSDHTPSVPQYISVICGIFCFNSRSIFLFDYSCCLFCQR